MKKLALIALLACSTSAHAAHGSLHVYHASESSKLRSGATDKKANATTSPYYNVHLKALEKAQEGGSTIYRGLSPEARREENQLLRQNYLNSLPNASFWN
jgi:hypothetical protein